MLKRVSIQNFKSLKDVTLDLQEVNLLIGPNNSGKSNFLKALEYISEYFQNIETVNSIKEDKNRNKSAENFYKYYNNKPKKLIYKKDENLELLINIQTNTIPEYKYKWSLKPEFDIDDYLEGYHSGESKIYEGKYSTEMARLFKNVIVYRLEPKTISQPGVIGKLEENINSDGSNIINFLDLMLSKYRSKVISKIEKDLSSCIPEFNEISLDNSYNDDNKSNLHSREALKIVGLTNNNQEITYWADELSEGTLYFLALLCIIHQPTPPKLLLLEEPEKGIHPRRIEEIINLIFSLAEEKDIQVIMTTHSPIVVDMFKDMPESVFIFDKDDEGATHVKNLQKDIIEPETAESERLGIDPPQYLNGLGQAWKVGLIGGIPR
ncbi:AAA family ATPase [Fibrella sp. WM1]|uniref:AAA family ATPase n=1 Tax=Fibrella musci TaxID=3242485 RepID=UPI0035225559